MQQYNIKIADRFEQELDEILDFIASHNLNEAIKFKDELYTQIATLTSMPYRCRQNLSAHTGNIRDFIFKGYVIVFAVNESILSVEILGIYKTNLWKN